VTDVVMQLNAAIGDDHERGCQGRCYACTCGFDTRIHALLRECREEVLRLRAERDAAEKARQIAFDASCDASAAQIAAERERDALREGK